MKKLISFIIVLVMAFSSVFVFAEANGDGASLTRGDLSGDGSVTDDDAIYLLMYTFFPDDYPVSQDCDYTGD